MAVTLSADLLSRYRRFSLYNSPYPAHDAGRAIDLYPPAGAPSPVAGEVLDVRTVDAPSQPYADDHDHLVVLSVDVDASPLSWTGEATGVGADVTGNGDAAGNAGVGDPAGGGARGHGESADGDHGPADGLRARILHVTPAVEPGDRVAVGDNLGDPVRSGYFAPWVGAHLHLGFRPPGADPLRATGSLPVRADVPVEPLDWDGTGTVVEVGDTYAVLDAPAHPAPGERFVGVAARVGGDGRSGTAGGTDANGGTDADGSGGTDANGGPDASGGSGAAGTVALDGGLPHYAGGGALVGDGASAPGAVAGPVTLAGDRVGVADGRDVAWDDVAVLVDGEPVTGLSLFAARDGRFGAKLVCPGGPPATGETVTVSVRRR